MQRVAAGDDMADAARVATDSDLVLPRAIRRWVDAAPDRVFLQEVDGRTVTYGALLSEAERWSGALTSLGLGAGDAVATMFRPSVDAHAVWLGTVLAGALEVPLNVEHRGDPLVHVLTDWAPAPSSARWSTSRSFRRCSPPPPPSRS